MDRENRSTRRRGPSAEMITAIAAVFIGVCAIAVSLYETMLIRQQQRGSMWPNIELLVSYNQDGFVVNAENTGVGPARVRHVELLVDDEPVDNWGAFLAAFGLDAENMSYSSMAGRVFAPGQELLLLRVPDQAPALELWRSANRASLTICYCSVYEDCWIRAVYQEPIPVRHCPDQESGSL